MRYNHTKQYYERWINYSGLTYAEMRQRLKEMYMIGLKDSELIDYMVSMNFTADDLNYIKNWGI